MRVDGTNLAMVRGDTEAISVTCSTPFDTGDTVTFSIRKKPTTGLVLQKVVTEFTDGVALISIFPADTAELAFGKYVYDIQVNWANGTVKTIVEKSEFWVKDEVTF